MDNKKLLLGLTVLATPFVVENFVETNVASANQATQQVTKSSEYVLDKAAKAYLTSNDAANRVNQKATYQAGTYYVYNQNQGMVNISRATGRAGAWINPTDNPNAKLATETTVTPSKTRKDTRTEEATRPADTSVRGTNLTLVQPKAGQYSLLKSTDAYVNAIDASRKVNSKGRVSAGHYYIYKEYNGMLNISKFQGRVGSWINPASTTIADLGKTTSRSEETTTSNTTKTRFSEPTRDERSRNTQSLGTKTNAGLFTLTASTEAYVNALDAGRKVNARGRVAAGSYHIFREYQGMLNISRTHGRPGSWINPGTFVPEEVRPSAETKRFEENTSNNSIKPVRETSKTVANDGSFTLTKDVNVYLTASDAINGVNARAVYKQGNYYVFREYKGMLNISKVKGRVGSWINPEEAAITLPKTNAVPNTREQAAPLTSDGRGVDYYTQNTGSWANKRYGNWTMRDTGCLPTSLAMVVSTLAKKVTPVQIADYLYNNTRTFNKTVLGTTQDAIPVILGQYGLKYKLIQTKENLRSELAKGALVLANVQGPAFINPGYTHAVVLKGLDAQGRSTVYNPYSTYGIVRHTIDTIWNGKSKDPIDYRLGSQFVVVYK